MWKIKSLPLTHSRHPFKALVKPSVTSILSAINTVSDVEMQTHYDDFFEDIFIEMEDKYGEIEEMNVCDNLGDHLVGNVYVKFKKEEDADKAVNDLKNRHLVNAMDVFLEYVCLFFHLEKLYITPFI